MHLNQDKVHLHLPLELRPRINQVGLGEHGLRSRETFVRPRLWALHLYFWKGSLGFEGKRFDIQPHNIGLTPPDTPLTWFFPLEPCRHYFVHFSFNSKARAVQNLPVMCSLGQRFQSVRGQFEHVLNWTPENPTRAEVALWDLLWQLTDQAQLKKIPLVVRPGPVETAIGIIENELDQHLNAKSLAARVALSYSQLNRLFKDHLHMTLAKYIAAQRFKRAGHLLRESNMPVKVIAERVGIPDIQHFNKFIRHQTGLSPRNYRDEQSSVF